MRRTLLVNAEKCTGCRLCELVCSAHHTGKSNPSVSRIKVVKPCHEGPYFPRICCYCIDTPCIGACPENAIRYNEEHGQVIIDYARCREGCRECLPSCPFGIMSFDERLNKAANCDYCQGDPQCVRFCYTKAVDFVELNIA